MELYIFIGIGLILLFFVVNLLRKNEKYEDIIQEQNTLLVSQNEILYNIFDNIRKSKEFINSVDEKGIFQSDDEVGVFFNYLKDIQQSLEEYFNNISNAKNQ